jgi:hypothetical protein
MSSSEDEGAYGDSFESHLIEGDMNGDQDMMMKRSKKLHFGSFKTMGK